MEANRVERKTIDKRHQQNRTLFILLVLVSATVSLITLILTSR